MNWTNSFKKLSSIYIEEFEGRWQNGVRTAKEIYYYINANYPHVSRILDIPAGIGRLSIPLSLYGFDVLGIDFSDKFIEHANKKKLEFGAKTSKFIVGDMFSSDESILRFKPQLVINWWTSIGYKGKRSDITFFKHLKSVTEPGALFIIETWSREYILNFPIRRFWNDLGNIMVTVENHIDPLQEAVESEHRYFRMKGNNLQFIGKFNSRIMLYSVVELKNMLSYSGWRVLKVSNSINQSDSFKPQVDRVVLICESS